MKTNIKLSFFSFLLFLMSASSSMWGDLCIEPMNKEAESIRRDLTALSKRIEAFEDQHRCSFCELKNCIRENNSELISLRKELEIVKDQRCEIPKDLLEKLDMQQRSLVDSKELEQIQIKYGNNRDGMSTLHYAIKEGDINAVSLLLANGADPNSVCIDTITVSVQSPITALSRTAICNQFEIAQLLLSAGADVNFVAGIGKYYQISILYTLNYAAEFGSGNLITLLIENGAILDRATINENEFSLYPRGPLHAAAKSGNYDAVIALVNAGAKIDGIAPPKGSTPPNGNEGTPLDEAAKRLKYADNPQNLELVKFLVQNGATRRTVKYHENDSNLCPVISGYLKSVSR